MYIQLEMKKTIYSKFDKKLITELPQVASRDTCFLFRLNDIGIPPSVIRLLEDCTVPKIGLSWHDDLLSLHRRVEFNPGYFVDLQDIVKEIGIKDLSLQKLYANIFHQKISKRQRLTNWEADVLSDKQKLYAATDAWACIKLYEEITCLSFRRSLWIPMRLTTKKSKKFIDEIVSFGYFLYQITLHCQH